MHDFLIVATVPGITLHVSVNHQSAPSDARLSDWKENEQGAGLSVDDLFAQIEQPRLRAMIYDVIDLGLWDAHLHFPVAVI